MNKNLINIVIICCLFITLPAFAVRTSPREDAIASWVGANISDALNFFGNPTDTLESNIKNTYIWVFNEKLPNLRPDTWNFSRGRFFVENATYFNRACVFAIDTNEEDVVTYANFYGSRCPLTTRDIETFINPNFEENE